MTSAHDLLPHQLALVEEYRSESAPRVVQLDAPVGAGKSRALAVIAAERAGAGDLVIVVLPSAALVAQMTQFLNQVGSPPVAVYTTLAQFRLALDKGVTPWPNSGLVICSASVIQSPLATRALANTSPSLLVVDDVAASGASDLGRSLQALATRAHQIIFTEKKGDAWFPGSDMRRWTFPLTDREGRPVAPDFSVRVHEYPGDPIEARLVRRAMEFFQQLPSVVPNIFFTRTAIQSALLKRARKLETPEQLSLLDVDQEELPMEQTLLQSPDQRTIEAIWKTLDDFDELPPDGRLIAAIEEARLAVDQGLPVVIVAGLVQEVDYLAAAIEADGIPVSIVTASMRFDERLGAADKLRPGTVLVVTSAFFTDMQRPLPDGTRNLWFSPPRTRRQTQRRLGLGMSSHNVEIVLFRAIPHVTPADELVERLEVILQNPWHEGAETAGELFGPGG
jgi:hypothetical protein